MPLADTARLQTANMQSYVLGCATDNCCLYTPHVALGPWLLHMCTDDIACLERSPTGHVMGRELGNESSRFCSVSSPASKPNVLSGVSGRKYRYQLLKATIRHPSP